MLSTYEAVKIGLLIFMSEDTFSLVIFQVKYLGKAVVAHFFPMTVGTIQDSRALDWVC